MSHVTFFLLLLFGQSGEAYQLRVCYQRGLLRLVLETLGSPFFFGSKKTFLGDSKTCGLRRAPVFEIGGYLGNGIWEVFWDF